MVTWLQEHTLACDGPADIGQKLAEWRCEKDQGTAGGLDKTVYRVVLSFDASGLVEIRAEVDQRANEAVDIQHTQGFLADTIGAAPAMGPVGTQIGRWVDQHIDTGGAATFDGVQANLTPFRPITQLQLSFGD